MWVFGYGSLVWKVDFPYVRSLVGYIKGYSRRFYQHSIDHRGVPEKPGRVVTLLPADESDLVWGVAYEISPEQAASVSDHLNFREKNGYVRREVTFHPFDCSATKPFDLFIYIATPDNVSFAGEADIQTIARQVISCSGPSGTNKEYVYNLAAAMRSIAPDVHDEHLFELELAVKELDGEKS